MSWTRMMVRWTWTRRKRMSWTMEAEKRAGPVCLGTEYTHSTQSYLIGLHTLNSHILSHPTLTSSPNGLNRHRTGLFLALWEPCLDLLEPSILHRFFGRKGSDLTILGKRTPFRRRVHRNSWGKCRRVPCWQVPFRRRFQRCGLLLAIWEPTILHRSFGRNGLDLTTLGKRTPFRRRVHRNSWGKCRRVPCWQVPFKERFHRCGHFLALWEPSIHYRNRMTMKSSILGIRVK